MAREPRGRAELRGVGHLVKGDPPPESRARDIEFVGDTLDVRVDEVERVIVGVAYLVSRAATISLRKQEWVVLAEHVVREEGERDRHRTGVRHPCESGSQRPSLDIESPHDALERRDVRVDPVVAVLDLDGVGEIE